MIICLHYSEAVLIYFSIPFFSFCNSSVFCWPVSPSYCLSPSLLQLLMVVGCDVIYPTYCVAIATLDASASMGKHSSAWLECSSIKTLFMGFSTCMDVSVHLQVSAQALTVCFNVQKCLNWCDDNSYVFAWVMHLKGKKQDWDLNVGCRDNKNPAPTSEVRLNLESCY